MNLCRRCERETEAKAEVVQPVESPVRDLTRRSARPIR
jgi:hypothetical protein